MLEQQLRACYRVLELPTSATLEEVREAYRLLSRVWHPDRFAGNPDLLAKATARQQELNHSYQLLSRAYARGMAPLAEPQPTQGHTAATHHTAPVSTPTPTAEPPPPSKRPVTRWLRDRRVVTAGATLFAVLGLLIVLQFSRSDTPILTRGGPRVLATTLAVGGRHACASAATRVFCWGDNESGQRGVAEFTTSTRAVSLTLPDTVIALSAGARHTCALLADGRVRCWGGNYSGQLGNRSLDDRNVPSMVWLDARFTALATLSFHTCALTDTGALYCWGNDTDGQLGAGRPVAECRWNELRFNCSDQPELVEHSVPWRSVTAGGSHSCAVDANGRVYCWGSNRSGQLGVPTNASCRGPGGGQPCRRSPGLVEALHEPAIAVAAGAAHTCMLDTKGRAHCWGLNSHGQAGVSSDAQVNAPTALNTTLRFASIATGGYHSCGVTETGELYCWGSDEHGELRGKTRDRCADTPCATLPVSIVRTGVAQVAAGFGTTCIRRNIGEVVCWGRGEASASSPGLRGLARPRAPK